MSTCVIVNQDDLAYMCVCVCLLDRTKEIPQTQFTLLIFYLEKKKKKD